MIEEKWIDLHLHTNYSDGLLTPSQVVQKAKEVGLKAVAIVDHDTIDGIAEAVETGSRIGIEVVPGVELSSQYGGKDIHILAYYFDPDHTYLKRYLKKFREERYKRAAKMIQNLNRLGIHLTMDEVEERSKGGSIGRPHLAEVLMEKGYIETFQEAFHHYIGYHSEAYEEKYKIHPEEAFNLISKAKGLSFLAHPGHFISDHEILSFVKWGLDGIEIIHPKFNENRTQHLQHLAHKNDLLICGGSDCHGGRDGQFYIGKYNVPYTVLRDMKLVLRKRWNSHPATE